MKRTRAQLRLFRWFAVACMFIFLAACSTGAEESGFASASGTRSVSPEALFSILDFEGQQILGTADGYSLYIFTGDGLNESLCEELCALTFIPLEPPAEGEQRVAGDGVDPQLISQFERTDGIAQLSYAGRALYRFSADASPGDRGAAGSAGRWFFVSPEGTRVN